MTGPQIYRSINKVTEALAHLGIPKRHINKQEQYEYRSIDDLLNCLAPILAKQKLCILPRVIDREVATSGTVGGEQISTVVLRVAFDLISAKDGSKHTIEVCGEAMDASDKATAKAMSAAFKNGMIQAFCIPLAGLEDADTNSPRAVSTSAVHEPEPPEGWDAWILGISDIICSCESEVALRRVQETYRGKLKSLNRERRQLYDGLGVAFASRAAELTGNRTAAETSGATSTSTPSPSRTDHVSITTKDLADA